MLTILLPRNVLPMQFIFVTYYEIENSVHIKNDVFWNVTPCGSCKNRRLGGT
jgi:hypothetical protein